MIGRRQNLVIGLVHNVDAEIVRKHPVPDPEAIKKNLTVNADVNYTSHTTALLQCL